MDAASKNYWQTAKISPIIYVKQEPHVDDEGIWAPIEEHVRAGMVSNCRLVISKEMFIEAYNKWIKGE